MAKKKSIIVGLRKAYYAIMTDEATETYGKVKEFPGIREMTVTPGEESASIYAENMKWDEEISLGDIEASFDFTDIPDEIYAEIFGKKMSTEGGIIENANDVRPYVALLLEKTLTGGAVEYVILYKGKFMLPEDKAKTKEGTTEYQTRTVSMAFLPLSDGMWKYYVRSTATGFSAETWATKWGEGKEVIKPTIADSGF